VRILAISALLGLVWFCTVRGLLQAAQHAAVSRDPAHALPLLDWLDQLRPRLPETSFLRARAFRRLGKTDLYRQHLREAVRRGYPDESARRENWLMIAQSGGIREAEPYLQQLLLDQRGDGAEICEAFVSGYFANFEFGEGFRLLELWQADFPDDPRPWMIRGKYLQHIYQPDDALTAFRQAETLAPGDVDAWRRIVQILLTLHRYDEARTALQELLTLAPSDPEALILKAELALIDGSEELATQACMQVLEVDSGNHAARLTLSRIHLQAGRWSEAHELAAILYQETPWERDVMQTYAISMRGLGRKDEAETLLRRLEVSQQELGHAFTLMEHVRSHPDDVAARFQIARTLTEYGNPDDARVWLNSVLETQPDHAEARQLLAERFGQSRSRQPGSRPSGN